MNLRLLFVSIASILILILAFFIWRTLASKDAKTYNWDLELTNPKDYTIIFKNISYFKDNKEFKRLTSINTDGWVGNKFGNVLHSKIKEYLPDSVKLAWKEENSGIEYTLDFEFPKQKVLDYWNKNHRLLENKWGADYTKGQLPLKLGLAPGGLVALWLSNMDVNASNFAIEVENYQAIQKNSNITNSKALGSYVFKQKIRLGTPHFYPVIGKNVVNIYVEYYNGESQSINTKSKNESILYHVNNKRGWSFVKSIVVTWFNENDAKNGYKSTYHVAWSLLPIRKNYTTLRKTNFVYLLDRNDTLDGEWNTLGSKHVFELSEISREKMGR